LTSSTNAVNLFYKRQIFIFGESMKTIKGGLKIPVEDWMISDWARSPVGRCWTTPSRSWSCRPAGVDATTWKGRPLRRFCGGSPSVCAGRMCCSSARCCTRCTSRWPASRSSSKSKTSIPSFNFYSIIFTTILQIKSYLCHFVELEKIR